MCSCVDPRANVRANAGAVREECYPSQLKARAHALETTDYRAARRIGIDLRERRRLIPAGFLTRAAQAYPVREIRFIVPFRPAKRRASSGASLPRSFKAGIGSADRDQNFFNRGGTGRDRRHGHRREARWLYHAHQQHQPRGERDALFEASATTRRRISRLFR